MVTALLSYILLSQEVLLELPVADPAYEQAEDDPLTVVVHLLAVGATAHHSHVALSSFGRQVGQETLYRLAGLLLNSVELCGSGLVSLLGHAAGDDVLGELLLRELGELGLWLLYSIFYTSRCRGQVRASPCIGRTGRGSGRSPLG